MDSGNSNINPGEPKVKNYWTAVLVAIPFLIITSMIWLFLNYQNKIDNQKRVEVEAEKLSSYVTRDLNNRITALRRMASRWEIASGTDEKKFRNDALEYIKDLPGFETIEWISSDYSSRWVVPQQFKYVRNRKKNFILHDKSTEAMQNAMRQKEYSITPPIEIPEKDKGFIVFFPLFSDNQLNGFILASFRTESWLDYVFSARASRKEFNNFRVSVSIENQPVYVQDGFEKNDISEKLEASFTDIIHKRSFLIRCRPTETFIKSQKTLLPEFAAGFGFIMSVLIGFIVFLFLRANNETWRSVLTRKNLEEEVNERKDVEQKLRDTTAKLNLAAKAGQVGIWSWDIKSGNVEWDEIMYELYDIPKDTAPNFRLWEKTIHPEDVEKTFKLLDETVKGEAVFDTEFRIILPGKKIRYIHAAARIKRDDNGEPFSMSGVNWDISELKETENALLHQSKMQKVLMDISLKYINIPLEEVDNSVENALNEMGKFVDADRVYVFDYDFIKKTTSNKYEWTADNISPQIEDLQNIPLDIVSDFVEYHRRGRHLIIEDVNSLPPGSLRELLEPQEIKTLVTVPLDNGAELLGFVGFDWVRNRHSYSDKEINLLTLFARILVNIKLRQSSEENLVKSRNRLDLALKGTNAGIWDWNVQTGETIFNERWAEIAGYNLKELQPVSIHTWTNLCHPDDLKDSEEKLNDHFNGKTDLYECEARIKHKNGDWIWVIDRGKVVEWDDNGNPVRMTGTHVDITARKHAEDKITYLANHDALTGLPTLRLARDRGYIAIQRSLRNNSKTAFMFIDLDGFKAVNDNFGHDAGDILLKESAKRFQSCIRKADTVARIGGDEFLIIISEFNTKDDLIFIAEKILKEISTKFIILGNEMQVFASIGISVYPQDGTEPEELVKLADQSMYKIKHSSKNGYAFADINKTESKK
jgi:diguanylate cyclase (GGDEF)-like protein/PAS domain S-box-containing protein